MQISVVIPAFNEAKVIAATVQEAREFLKNKFSSFEIIIVDDCSTDSTLKIIKSLPDVQVLRNLKNHGKGYTVAKGVKAASGDWILFMDADNSTRIVELDNFFEYSQDYDLLIASRALSDSKVKVSQSFLKVILGKAGNLLSRLLIHPKIHDTQCGFKLFRRELKSLFANLTISGWAFDFELIWLARKNNFRIKELGVVWVNDFDSKVRWYTYPQTLLQLFIIRLNDLLGKYNN